MLFSSLSVVHAWFALTEEVQVDIWSLVNILAPSRFKCKAVPCFGVFAFITDTIARAEVEIAVVLGGPASSLALHVMVPVRLFDQIPQTVDGLDLVTTEAVEPHGIKLEVEA